MFLGKYEYKRHASAGDMGDDSRGCKVIDNEGLNGQGAIEYIKHDCFRKLMRLFDSR